MRIVKKQTRKLRITHSQCGFTLIEAVIGVALLVVVGVAVLTGISTAFKASSTSDKISTALAIGQSQLDYIQTQNYDPTGAYIEINSDTRGSEKQDISPYIMTVTVTSIDESGVDTSGVNTGLQRITISVEQPGSSTPVEITGYKANPFKN
jgi:type II secretory pathway pseudopilin PulG